MGRRSAKKKTPAPAADDASFLIDQLQAEENSERAWREMTTSDADEDVWGKIEEHLVHQPHEHNHKLRRWKYFAK